jgi:very-short-patch-repair endonuclease
VISNPHPFIILAIDAPVETLSSPHLDGVCRAAVWLCDAAHVGVALLMPTSFVGESAIDSVDYQPLYWQPDIVEFKTSVSHRVTYSQPATKPPDSTKRDPPSSQIHRVNENTSEEDKLGPLPILGRPHPGSPGEMALAKAMEANAELAGRFGFNQPVRTTCGRRFIVDLLSSSDRVVVEVDGYRHHSSRRMFSADRDRDFRLHCDGYAVLRLPHHEVIQDVAAAIQIIVKFVGQAPTRVTTHTRK